MKNLKWLSLLFFLLFTACNGNNAGGEKIDIYVSPLYDSTPLEINIGRYSERLKTNNPKKMLALADEIKANIDEVDCVTLYVLAIRLYNLGKKDEAVYWYHTAQFRKNIFLKMARNLSPSGAPAAIAAFNTLSGKWINGYAGGDVDKWVATLEKILAESKNMGYIAKAYQYENYSFWDESEQQAIVDENIAAVREHGINYLLKNKEEIRRQRKENGIEGKY